MKKVATDKVGGLNLLVIVLSFYVLGVLVAETFFDLSIEIIVLLRDIDNVLCGFFFIEFCIRFAKAEDKLRFMRWGWIDLVASIPMTDFLHVLRVFRLIRLVRILMTFKSVRQFIDYIFKNRAQGAFTTVSVLAVLLILFSSIAILEVETAPDSNIRTAEDALWWTYVTFTTVGYGDKFPVTTEGRIVAVILMTGGIALFGTFTAFVASWFVPGHRNSHHTSSNAKHKDHSENEELKASEVVKEDAELL
jgi:voltage-gated potassium channel